jgi:hypothetical protein
MTVRKYIIISATLVICLFAFGLWCWSPQASVDKRLSILDSFLLRVAVRAHTVLPIYEIGVERNGWASVIAGGVIPWIQIPREYALQSVNGRNVLSCYYFERTGHAWRSSRSPVPVDFGVDPPSPVNSGLVIVAEFVGLSALSLFWCLRMHSRRQVRLVVYVWLGFFVLLCLWSSMPTRYYVDPEGKPMSADTSSYYITAALIGLVFGLSWPPIVALSARCLHGLRRYLQSLSRGAGYAA